MYIPNCRIDENYNEKYLDEQDKEFIRGYDYAVEMVNNLFNNLDVFPDFKMLLEDNIAIIKEGKADIAQDAIANWLEMDRDEIITSMIDGYGERKYTQIKEKVNANENI